MIMNSMKSQNDRILKGELPRSVCAQYAPGDQWRTNSRKNEGMEPKQKQDQELTVAQIINSVLPNSDLSCRKEGKPLGHSGMTKIKSLSIIQWK